MLICVSKQRAEAGGCTYCFHPPIPGERVWVIRDVGALVSNQQQPIELRMCDEHAREMRETLEMMT